MITGSSLHYLIVFHKNAKLLAIHGALCEVCNFAPNNWMAVLHNISTPSSPPIMTHVAGKISIELTPKSMIFCDFPLG